MATVDYRQRLKPRFAALGIIVVGILGVLLVRLWTMQVLFGETFAAQAEDNRIHEIPLDAARGRILDRKGRPLVTNRAALAVTVEPGAKDDRPLVDDLSALLGIPADEIEERLSSVREAALKPRVVAVDVPMRVVAYLEENSERFPGVEAAVVAVRDYPGGSTAAHVLGYTGEISERELVQADLTGYRLGDTVGKSGAERQFETVLQGDRGYRRIEVDARGRPKGVIEEIEPVPGRDVRLTIDLDVQEVAEKALADALEEARAQRFPKAKAGAVVAMDVRSGEVLAMASAPTYDPGLFLGGISSREWKRLNDEGSEYPLNNRAIMAAYPPASTFKLVTGAAALDAGIASEWTTYRCSGKWSGMGEQWSKYCWNRSGHGSVSFRRGIQDSCDTVFYEIGYAFYKRGEEEIQEVARRFGYGAPTGVDLPGEVGGRVPDAAWKKKFNENYPEAAVWVPGDTVNMAIGQGDMLATPLQLAVSYAAIANGGEVLRPRVLDAVLDVDGKAALQGERRVERDLKLSRGRIGVLRRGLRDVTTGGTAAAVFRGFGTTVEGKTGTAEVNKKDDYALFVGYAPAENPRYVVAAVVEQGGHGGSVAGPAARSVLGKLLGLSTERVHATDVSR
ncbi:MAG: penicillin-binding protein 2 [Coriobacteriia bacterium]|nr:penicillin-binding protein 2 [Coriobacteriia bacterium]